MSGFFADGRWWDLTDADLTRVGKATEALIEAGVRDPAKEAQRLFVAAQHEHSDPYEDLIARRADRVPMSHLLGYRDFYKYRFKINADVLDPRPETEILVLEALRHPFSRVLDLGTGSGCILLSLLAERPEATGVGIDISEAALSVAGQNALALGVDPRVAWVQSDWLAQVSGTFDLIVSNPPYIALDEMPKLAPEVRLHEPRTALTDEADGLDCYRRIIAEAPRHLTPGGVLLLEIGPTQGGAVSQLLAHGGFASVRVIQDLDGRERVISACLPAE